MLVAGSLVFALIVAAVISAVNNAGIHVAANSGGATHPASASSPNTQTSSPPPAPSGVETLAVGDTLTVQQDGGPGADIVITKVVKTRLPADPTFGERPQFGWYIIATIRCNSQTDGFDINGLDFYALVHGRHFDEGNGNSFEAVDNINDVTSTLNSGETATGQLLFDLPSRHGKIVYAPNFDGSPLAQWQF